MTRDDVLELDEIADHRVYGLGIYTEEAEVLTERLSSPDNLFLTFPFQEIPKEVSKSFLQRELC